AFAFWAAGVARMIGGGQALSAALAACEAALRVPSVAEQPAFTQLRETAEQLRSQVAHLEEPVPVDPEAERRRHSRKLCDEGQAALRNQRFAEALAILERAIEADETNSTAWLWKALALTDVARFDEALQSYDQAI